MKIKKKIPLIDQHDKNYLYGKKFGGNYIPETLKKPVEDLTKLFEKLRYEKKFLKERNYYFKNYVGTPTPFFKLENLTKHLGGAEVLKFGVNRFQKPTVVHIKFIMLQFMR